MVTPSSLLHILLAADKFEVASCVQYCIQLLIKLPMTCDIALSCLDLPSCVSHADALQQLTDLAKQYIAVHFRDIEKIDWARSLGCSLGCCCGTEDERLGRAAARAQADRGKSGGC
ncbi:hypothetical protein POM88_024914 [Heracleum sosnowskyi]|uniref:Uncharacterized protein n=1 Tax=Heracleum sosnowskyi TaxID=360622 RepID=A0AAD8I3Y7_9APIA|nr:hypothetical protein POM88_024914 [Heracleum sosnowskyi]